MHPLYPTGVGESLVDQAVQQGSGRKVMEKKGYALSRYQLIAKRQVMKKYEKT